MVTNDGRCTSEIQQLVERIRQVTATIGDPLGDLAGTIQVLINGETDAYLLAGVLIEGAVQAVMQRVPLERRTPTSLALLQLLADRLRVLGQIDPPPG